MLTINLFDANFRQSVCSVAYQTPEHICYVRSRAFWNGITLFTDGHLFDGTVNRVNSPVKVGWLREPRCLWPQHYEQAPAVVDKFDFILTYCKHLLKLPGFKFAPYGGIWIDRQHWGMKDKTKLVSMLYGSKLSTDGHKLRHSIASAIGDDFGIDYYGHRGQATAYGPETKLLVLGDHMFSIVGETCRENNLFTEILLDCFAVGTIPIFWGAPNIGTYFNINGMLVFETVSELLLILNRLSTNLYRTMLAAARENLALAKRYAVTEDWMYGAGVFDD